MIEIDKHVAVIDADITALQSKFAQAKREAISTAREMEQAFAGVGKALDLSRNARPFWGDAVGKNDASDWRGAGAHLDQITDGFAYKRPRELRNQITMPRAASLSARLNHPLSIRRPQRGHSSAA